MTLYTVLAPPLRQGESRPDPIALVFIKEGYCWPALFFPAIWPIFRRMWLVLVLYVAVAIGLVIVGEQGHAGMAVVLAILAALWFPVEANGLRRWSYLIRGYRILDVVEGGNLREAELRYFLEWPAIAPSAPPPPAEKPPVRLPSAEAGDVIGLFPAPGGRP